MFFCLLLNGTQESVDALNWNLKDGAAVVDRFEADTFVVVMMKK